MYVLMSLGLGCGGNVVLCLVGRCFGLLLGILWGLTVKDLLEYLATLTGESRRRSSAWLERRPGKAEVPGSNPGGGLT